MLITTIGAWVGAFWGTHTPAPGLVRGVSDKTMHFSGYAVLAMLMSVTMTVRGQSRGKRLLWAIIVFPIYAALDELTQPIVNRHCDIMDWVADVSGALLMVAAWELLMLISQIRRRLR